MRQFDSSNDNQIVSYLVHAVGGAGAGDHGIWPKGAYWQHQIYYVGNRGSAKGLPPVQRAAEHQPDFPRSTFFWLSRRIAGNLV